MWINLQPDQLATLREGLRLASASTMHDEMKALGAFIDKWEEDARSPEHKAYRDTAWEQVHKDGEIEIDSESDGTNCVSTGDDPGAYVMAWVWIDSDDAGLTFTCEDCNSSWTIDQKDRDECICKECRIVRDADDAEVCPDCGAVEGTEEWGTVGDGYDGYCPSCADRREPDEDKYPIEDWQYEVSNGDTKLGYREWVASCKERDSD